MMDMRCTSVCMLTLGLVACRETVIERSSQGQLLPGSADGGTNATADADGVDGGVQCPAVIPTRIGDIGPTPPCDIDAHTREKLDPTRPEYIPEIQRTYAEFSWQSFIAVMWPTDKAGKPASALDAKSGQWPAWVHWTSRDRLVRGATAQPVTVPRMLSERDIRQATPDGDVLWDNSGRPVYYEVVVNQVLAEATENQSLDTRAGQLSRWKEHVFETSSAPDAEVVGTAFGLSVPLEIVSPTDEQHWVYQAIADGQTICVDASLQGDKVVAYKSVWANGIWLDGGVSLPWGNPERSPPALGSMALKLAWKVMDPVAGDELARFVHLPAVVQHNDGTEETVEVGLVGFHIAHKALSAMTWLWATFEQVDNLPLETDPPSSTRHFSFYNPACKECRTNTPTPTGTPTQLVRKLPIEDVTQAVNASAQGQLEQFGSVLQYYRLVGAQWPTNPALANSLSLPCIPSEHDAVPSGAPQPARLTNPVIESFNQDSSCMDCHATASIATGGASKAGDVLFARPGSADFMFLFTHAR